MVVVMMAVPMVVMAVPMVMVMNVRHAVLEDVLLQRTGDPPA